MKKKTLRDVDVAHKRVLVREDLNVPLGPDGAITDDRRIEAAVPTLKYLMDHHAKVIVAAHLGRPKGKRDEKYSLKPVATRLCELLGAPVKLAPDSAGPDVEQLAKDLKDGEVLLLENIRFHPGEEKNDPELAKRLAALADIYVNDAFGAAHRAHASTEGVAHHLPAVAGFLMEKEINYLSRVLEDPERPFVSILGGAKVGDKIGVIRNLLEKVDRLIIGGGMAYTFFKAQGYEIGKSLLDKENIDVARETLEQAKQKGVSLELPVDIVVGKEFSNDTERKVVPATEIPEGWEGLDIGPETREKFRRIILDAKTVVWNGPMGVFEFPN
ncbi:MAG: phosphoglycerate kinase, partial [Armatimonadetes bacterium]|nr:phosphoglycerate kinase [Armatimonadota bacterium]